MRWRPRRWSTYHGPGSTAVAIAVNGEANLFLFLGVYQGRRVIEPEEHKIRSAPSLSLSSIYSHMKVRTTLHEQYRHGEEAKIADLTRHHRCRCSFLEKCQGM